MGEDPGAVPVRQLPRGPVMVAVAVGEDDAPDPGRVVAERADPVLDRGGRRDVARVDQRQVRPVAPEIRLTDPEAEHVHLGAYLDEIHAANVRSGGRTPHGSTLRATSPRA
ncbi:hypothetical protein GCM10010264_70010 [Streptomyces globisporus]|nr:hypothetical protein GCM10010264_70010 [Streptomyces globisporus]